MSGRKDNIIKVGFDDEALEIITKAAALGNEPVASYIRRVVVFEARRIIRDSE